MNQDQVVALLLKLDDNVDDFTVTFTGKKSKKVDGLYKPQKKEIIIHNKNFINDNSLVYTAIHEFAHHIQFTRTSAAVSPRVHNNRFWNIFHRLLFIAEEKKIFNNIFKQEPEFLTLTKKIKENFLTANSHLIIEFGRSLLEAYELCRKFGASFEDYVDRELQFQRTTAKTLIKLTSMNINPEIGYENMKIVAGIKKPEERESAIAAFSIGKSADMVKAEYINHNSNNTDNHENHDALEDLLLKKQRLEQTISKLTAELANVEKSIRDFSN